MKKIIKTELIIEYMRDNNLSKDAFCKKCKIDISVLNKILNNQHNFRITALIKIARELRINTWEMFLEIE